MTTWPHTTLKIVSSSPSTAAQEVVQNVPEMTSHNTRSALTEGTQAGATTLRPVSLSSLIPLRADADSNPNKTTAAPEFMLNAVTTAGVFKSPHNHTNLNNVTTPTSSPDSTRVPNVAIDDIVSPNITDYNVATIGSQQEQLADVVAMTNTTANVFTTTAAHNQTRKHSTGTTVTSPSNPVYFNATATTEAYKTESNRNHHNRTNSSPSAAEYSTPAVTPPSNTATTESTSSVNTGGNDGNPDNGTVTRRITTSSHHTTTSYNYTTHYNITDSLMARNNTTGTFPPNYDTFDANTLTYDRHNTAVSSVATAANSYTTEFADTTSGTATGNTTKDTFMPDYTNMKDMTTVSAPNSNAVTVSPHDTVTGTLSTSAFGESVSNATAVTQYSAQSTVPLLNTVTTPTTHNVTPSNRLYATANTGSTANVSQTTTKAPAVISSATAGNAIVGHIATDTSNLRGSPSAHNNATTATLPLASPTAAVFSAAKSGIYRLKLLSLLTMSKNGEDLNILSRNTPRNRWSDHQNSAGGTGWQAAGSNPRRVSAQLISGEPTC